MTPELEAFLATEDGQYFLRFCRAVAGEAAPPAEPAEHEMDYAPGNGPNGFRAFCGPCSRAVGDYVEDCAIADQIAAHNHRAAPPPATQTPWPNGCRCHSRAGLLADQHENDCPLAQTPDLMDALRQSLTDAKEKRAQRTDDTGSGNG